MVSASDQGVCSIRKANTPFCRMPDFCGSNCVRPSRVATCKRRPCSGTIRSVPRCLLASRMTTCGAGQAFVAFTPGPAKLMVNCCRPSVLPGKCSVMTRPASVLSSVQWLKAEPLMESTSKPAGIRKLSRKIPARVMSAAALTARTVRSSPSDSVSCVSTRTSGSTDEAFNTRTGVRLDFSAVSAGFTPLAATLAARLGACSAV